VLDDVAGEAEEVYAFNPWLAYGPPLHAAREFGLQAKLFDLLDEKKLIPSQIKQFAEMILGCAPLPEPELDEKAFAAALQSAMAQVPDVYDPHSKMMKPWIDLKRLSKRRGSCAIS